MHIFPTFIFTIIGASLAAEDSIDSSIFELDNHKNLVPLTPDSSDLIAWNDKSYPDTVSFSADENELDADLFATDCALTGRLGGRDDSGWKKSTCAADERKLKIPELPTLDDLTIPLGSNENENQGPFHEIVPTRGLLFKNDDSDVCPISKPYHLCCLCDHLFMFELCQACKPMAEMKDGCVAPYIEVCCQIYGVTTLNEDTDDPNLDMWLRLYMRYNFNENQESGMLAKFCEPVFIPRGTP